MKHLSSIALILLSLCLQPPKALAQGDPCTSITFPYILTGTNNTERIANLRQAILCANANGNSTTDVIDLNGHSLSAQNSYNSSISGAFPAIDSKIELRNGAIDRSSSESFRFFHVTAGSELTLANMTLSNGYGYVMTTDGGAIYNDGTLNIHSSKLIGNTATNSGYGGAIFSSNATTLRIVNSLIAGNRAGTGGAIRNRGNATLTNVTIAGNFAAANGGGIASAGNYSLSLNNTLVFANESPSNANMEGNYTNNSSLVGVDPSFVNAPDASDSAPTIVGDYRLNLGSAAIDAGNSSLINSTSYPKDLAGTKRISGTKIDIGAYEFSFETLPVSLLTFTAKREPDHIRLYWSTSSETDNDKYIVLRASEDRDFHQIGEIRAKADPNAKNTYQFYDRNPLPGNNYYLLRQRDKDGEENDLGEKAVSFTIEANFSLYPNPTIGQVTAHFKKGEFKTLTLLSSMGNKIQEIALSAQQQATFDLTALPKGIYFVRLSGPVNQVTKKVVRK